MKSKTVFQVLSFLILLVSTCLLCYGCKSPISVEDELNGYTKVNRLDTIRTFPDKFYFEVYLSVIQSATDWEAGPTLIFPDSSVWEYRANTDLPGDDKLLILTWPQPVEFNNHGNKNASFVIGFSKQTSYDLGVNNTGAKKGTVYFLFKRTTKKYSEAPYRL